MTKVEAIKGSIKKWVNIRDGKGSDEGRKNCPLCEKYGCDEITIDCPIYKYSGEKHCNNTPYFEWGKHHLHGHLKIYNPFIHNYGQGEPELIVRCPTCKRIADLEVKFLRKILRRNQECQR